MYSRTYDTGHPMISTCIGANIPKLALPAVPAWEHLHCTSSTPAEPGWCRGAPRQAGVGGGGRSWADGEQCAGLGRLSSTPQGGALPGSTTDVCTGQ